MRDKLRDSDRVRMIEGERVTEIERKREGERDGQRKLVALLARRLYCYDY